MIKMYCNDSEVKIEDYDLSEQQLNIVYKIILNKFEDSCRMGVEDVIFNCNYNLHNLKDDPYYICYMTDKEFYGTFGNKFFLKELIHDLGLANVWVYNATTCDQINIDFNLVIGE
jgi:hypothetical protein